MTAAELADELEVSERTIYRDLEALHARGIPVLAERGPGGRHARSHNYRSNLTGLSEHEVRALFIGCAGPWLTWGWASLLRRLCLKLTQACPPYSETTSGRCASAYI